MRSLLSVPLLGLMSLLPGPAAAADPPKRDWEAVELVGRATDYWYSRNWRSYYWREDFTFLLAEEGTGKTWRVISREPTPAYEWRMGTTYTGLKLDWKARPRVKVVGVKAVDRLPAEFYDFKLDEPNILTAFIVSVETEPRAWKEYYVNNWFHKWGDKADRFVHGYYADKKGPYDVYGYALAQAAPFDKKSQTVIDRHKADGSLKFHGLVHAAEGTPFGYEIELIDLIGRDRKTGGPAILFGDARTIPLLDGRKPEK